MAASNPAIAPPIKPETSQNLHQSNPERRKSNLPAKTPGRIQKLAGSDLFRSSNTEGFFGEAKVVVRGVERTVKIGSAVVLLVVEVVSVTTIFGSFVV